MRSRLICSLVSLAIFATVSTARADVTRLRMSIEELPRQDTPIPVAAKNVLLPSGAREGGPVPKTWLERVQTDSETLESGRCTDERRGSVGTIYGDMTSTRKIWEANGKTWLDSADIATNYGIIKVSRGERVPLARIADGIWAFRRQNEVVVVSARDVGFIERGAFFECRISDNVLTAPAGAAIVDSSPDDANRVMTETAMWGVEDGQKPRPRAPWTGVQYRVLASVSRAAADPAPMLNLVIRKP